MAGTDLSVERGAPEVSYTGLDRIGISANIMSYLQQSYPGVLSDVSTAQLMSMIVNANAVMGDLCMYRIDVVAREIFAATARLRTSQVNLGKGIGYYLQVPESATVTITAMLNPTPPGGYPLTISHTDQYSNGSSTAPVIFQPTEDVYVAAYPSGGTLNISCVEGTLYENVLITTSNGSANQRIQFPQYSVVQNSVQIFVNNQLWTSVATWGGTNSSSQVYKLAFDSKGNFFAIFGDGYYGTIPPNNGQIRATFRVGGGSRGNLPAVSPTSGITTIVNGNPAILSISNAQPSQGGIDFESVRSARYSIPASLSTLERAVSSSDFAGIALQVPGVAQASAQRSTIGARTMSMYIAPEGGGLPSQILRNNVVNAFVSAKVATTDVSVEVGYTYKNLIISFIEYINPRFKATDVDAAVRSFFTNPSVGTGVYDFDQLCPSAVDASGEFLLSQTVLQGYAANDLSSVGLDRLGVETFTIQPQALPRQQSNIGNGAIADASIIINAEQRRREYVVTFMSATAFTVSEHIVGYVSQLTDTAIIDNSKNFSTEGVASWAGYMLAPTRGQNALPVANVDGAQTITIANNLASLYALTAVGTEYALFSGTPTSGVVGVQWVSLDGSVKFTVTEGTTAFVAGDGFSIDTFPNVGDIQLRVNEYPQLLLPNFATRTSGGIR